MTEIEKLVFRDGRTHAVVGFQLFESRITIQVAPWAQLEARITAEFSEAKITSLDVYADDPDDLNLPWDIIGFDCYSATQSRWRFVLHGPGLEYGFESQWPQIVNETNQRTASPSGTR
jgi:hypothetical protein